MEFPSVAIKSTYSNFCHATFRFYSSILASSSIVANYLRIIRTCLLHIFIRIDTHLLTDNFLLSIRKRTPSSHATLAHEPLRRSFTGGLERKDLLVLKQFACKLVTIETDVLTRNSISKWNTLRYEWFLGGTLHCAFSIFFKIVRFVTARRQISC